MRSGTSQVLVAVAVLACVISGIFGALHFVLKYLIAHSTDASQIMIWQDGKQSSAVIAVIAVVVAAVCYIIACLADE